MPLTGAAEPYQPLSMDQVEKQHIEPSGAGGSHDLVTVLCLPEDDEVGMKFADTLLRKAQERRRSRGREEQHRPQPGAGEVLVDEVAVLPAGQFDALREGRRPAYLTFRRV